MSNTFRTLTIVKHPLERVWETMRDRMPELAASLVDIAEIRETCREQLGDMVVRVVNEWQANVKLPAGLDKLVSAEMLRWTDHAEWDDASRVCRWRVVPRAFSGKLVSQGETRLTRVPNLAATRVEFEGSITVQGDGTFLSHTVYARALQQTISSLIPRNFQTLCREVDAYLKVR